MKRLRRWLRVAWIMRPNLRLRRYEAGPMPPPAPRGYVDYIPDRGEVFYRDTGPETAVRGTLLLLHGWMADADINWAITYAPLVGAGYRIIAPDHRGHGRGLRTTDRFRLQDCAEDAAALVRYLRTGPVIAVGYSMGGSIAQLLARDHPDLLQGLVLAATVLNWRYRWVRWSWKLMAVLQFLLRAFPRRIYEWGTRGLVADAGLAHWLTAELLRSSAEDVAEAGRQMAEFDSRSWIGELDLPISVICTAEDRLVPPEAQREITEHARDAVLFEVPGEHVNTLAIPGLLAPTLLEALASIETRLSPVAAAVGGVVSIPRRPSLPVESRT